MRKAIQLQVTLWVEGEAEPATDFERLTKKAVRDVIAAGKKARPELKVIVKRITEARGDDDDEDDGDDGDGRDAEGERER